MEKSCSRTPSQALRRYIVGYAGYRIPHVDRLDSRVGPSRFISAVISLNGKLSVRSPSSSIASTAVLGGMHSGTRWVHSGCTPFGVRVSFKPQYFQSIFGVIASELANQVVCISDVVSHFGQLESRLLEVESWSERFSLLDEFFLELLQRNASQQSDSVVDRAYTELTGSSSPTTVASLAGRVGCSRRHLSGRVGNQLGITPKTLQQIVMFERACTQFTLNPRVTIAEAATIAGYSDQAHMTRQWRRYLGCTPTEWLARDLPFIQDNELPA